MSRPAQSRTRLLALGFQDPGTAEKLLPELGPAVGALLPVLGESADPDQALQGLIRLAEAVGGDDFLATVSDDEDTAARLVQVLGTSLALTDHLARHPDHWEELRDADLAMTRPAAYWVRAELLRAVGADPDDPTPTATAEDAAAVDALRVEYRRHLLRLAARDLAHGVGVDDVAAELSDLAAGTLEAALAIARQRVGEEADTARLAVVAMGKCGGHELNYVSDVDVIFAFEPVDGAPDDVAMRAATRLAANLVRICSEHTSEGTIWPVDAALRPEGRAGPLVRTLASHQGYYERWAKTWEFQALLKARPVAGDLEIGRRFRAIVDPLVWQVAEHEGFVTDVRTMRRRVVAHIPAHHAERQLKLGSGGLRDVEFAVQLLQLVHGRTDEAIRPPTTLSALAELTRRGYVGRDDGEAMHEAYAFLRRLEHRMQLYQLRRTHVVPGEQAALRRLGRSMGFLKDPVAQLDAAWEHHRREVRRLHEKLFYRPLLEAVAEIPGDQARLSRDAAVKRLAALGYDDPRGAFRHLEALTSGVSRTATIQRHLLPAMLGWFADAPDPDAGLFGFRQISETLGSTPWYLKTLRDEGQVAERLATILATSRYATGLLRREPEGVRLLANDLSPQPAAELTHAMRSAAARHDTAEDAVAAIRGLRRRELFRIAAGDVLGLTDVVEVGVGLSELTDAVLESTLEVAGRAVREDRGLEEPPTDLAIVAMGRYGGFEKAYGSDADVMFVHQPRPGADGQAASTYAHAVANELRRLLKLPMSDPALQVDADLRPEGRQGPLVRTIDSYAAYYAKWSQVWEAQALLRADAAIGDEEVRRRFTELIDPLRFPAGGLSGAEVAEIRRIKARVDTERLPRGADPNTHLKLGRGGLADIEWTVQLLQMRHAGEHASLRTTRTLDAIAAARDLGLLDAEDAAVLEHAWRTVSRTRNAVTLVRGKPGEHLPRDVREKAAVAMLLGYEGGESDRMVNDYLRITRRAHAVVERLFWDE